MSQSVALERGVINPAPEADGSENPESLSKDAIERLGRQRPVSLPTAYTEVGFVFAVVASMMMSEYFISGFDHLERERLLSEPQVLGRNETIQEDVDACEGKR